MTGDELYEQLSGILPSDDFACDSIELMEAWSSLGVGREAIDPILNFMELHPDVDYGAPGALVHFVETFYGSEYEDKIMDSVRRRPTMHTLWMLNRLINGSEETSRRDAMISVLRLTASGDSIDQDTRNVANDYLERIVDESRD